MVSQPRQPELQPSPSPEPPRRDGADHAQDQVHQGRCNDHDAEDLNRTMFTHRDRLLVDRIGNDEFAGRTGVVYMVHSVT